MTWISWVLLVGTVALCPIVIYGNHTHNASLAFGAIAAQVVLYGGYLAVRRQTRKGKR